MIAHIQRFVERPLQALGSLSVGWLAASTFVFATSFAQLTWESVGGCAAFLLMTLPIVAIGWLAFVLVALVVDVRDTPWAVLFWMVITAIETTLTYSLLGRTTHVTVGAIGWQFATVLGVVGGCCYGYLRWRHAVGAAGVS